MTEFTPARLAELRAVAEAATPGAWSIAARDDEGGVRRAIVARPATVVAGFAALLHPDQRDAAHVTTFDPPTVLALIAALEAKTAEVDAKADYVSDLEERVRQRDNHVIPVLHARIKEAERERDEARAEVDDLAADPGHKAAKYWKWWQREKARADRAEAALERVKGTSFKNRLYLMMMSYLALNNPAGESLRDKIDKLIQQTIEDNHE